MVRHSTDETADLSAAVTAGAVAGIAGLLAFLVVHHVWIRPIWSIAPIGALIAAIGGAAVGAAYAELRPHLPRRPWTAIALMALVGVMLAPAFALAELHGPVFRITASGGAVLTVPVPFAVFAFVIELLGVTAAAGAAVGWLVARTRGAALRTAAAGFIFALGPGHNFPFLGGTAVAWKGWCSWRPWWWWPRSSSSRRTPG